MKPQSMPFTASRRICVQHPSTAECLQLFLDRRLMRESDGFTGSAPWGMLPGEQLAQHAAVSGCWEELLETAKAGACGAGGQVCLKVCFTLAFW